jgi:hypothetical protein
VIVGRGCLGRPWLFRELAQAFDGREPERPPNLGEVREILLDHARRLIEFFGPVTALQQMRKWCAWYTKGFRNSSAVRERLQRVETYEQLLAGLADLDPTEPFPPAALRAHRGKSGRTQTVSLPLGYLDDLEDATPPCEMFDAAEAEKYDGG